MRELLEKPHASVLGVHLILNWLVFKWFIISLRILFDRSLRTLRCFSRVVLTFVIIYILINLDFSFDVFNLYILAVFIITLFFYQLSQTSLWFIQFYCHEHFLYESLTFLFACYHLIMILDIHLILIKLYCIILLLLLIHFIFVWRQGLT